MKQFIIFAAAAFLTASALAQGNFSAPIVRRETLPPVNAAAQSEGGLQRGFRLGNPLQMFNPFAPGFYGEGREFISTHDAGTALLHGRYRAYPMGLRLFSIAF